MIRFTAQRSHDRPGSARAAHRRAAAALLLGTIAITTFVACDDRAAQGPTIPTLDRATADVSGSDSTAGGYVLGCPPRPTVTTRQVTPNTAEDANGNGVVCDEDTGAPDGPSTRTLDDVFLPTSVGQ